MEEKLFTTAYHDIFHEVFPGISPCTCHQTIPYLVYDIEFEPGELVGAGRIIKKITVQCGNCGKEETFDVENREVFEDDIDF